MCECSAASRPPRHLRQSGRNREANTFKMVNKYKRKTSNASWDEAVMKCAMEEAGKGSVNAAAKKYGINLSTLQRHIKKGSSEKKLGRPLPQIIPQKTTRRRKPQKAEILTSTPIKDQQREKENKKKVSKTKIDVINKILKKKPKRGRKGKNEETEYSCLVTAAADTTKGMVTMTMVTVDMVDKGVTAATVTTAATAVTVTTAATAVTAITVVTEVSADRTTTNTADTEVTVDTNTKVTDTAASNMAVTMATNTTIMNTAAMDTAPMIKEVTVDINKEATADTDIIKPHTYLIYGNNKTLRT
ncbi:unnamed protein product [Diatraea saccharalis]|uniref:HTH psq-type domain-containing protein n=1 Tax=Diatraea saccharalis TaxID=40085 RepID=A0A9N9WJW8_9NEOP|nr:unnamed protein product [Diatraea saccharalis]